MDDLLYSTSFADHIPTVTTTQPGGEYVFHRRVSTAHESDDYGDDDDASNDTSSVYSTSSTSGVSYSDDSMEHLEKPAQSNSSDDDDTASMWARKGPYMYNGRTFVISIPGLLLMLAVGGETLLTVVTCGGLVVHLCLKSGNKSRSLLAYVVVFICIQMIVLYSVVPLLWKSLYTYAVIVPTINMFSVMTGAWFLLAFDNFNHHEVELAQYIEVLLFTLYPVLCVIILTWLSLALLPAIYTPYVFTLTGFAVLQFYLIPAPSSYRKPVEDPKDDCNVLDPAFPACFGLLFCWMPLSVFLVITAATDSGQMFQWATVVECFFIATLSVFLATFFNLRQFLEDAGLSYYGITITRQSCGYASVLGFCHLLYCRHILSHLLPWLPVAVILHMIFGALWSWREKKLYLQIVTVALILYYLVLFQELPWTLDYYIADGRIIIGVVFSLLLVNCLLTVACMYVSLYNGTETFGFLLLVQTLGFVMLERLLLHSGLYSLLLMAAVTAFLIYVVLRLHHSKKLLWQPALAIVSVHLTVLWNGINVTYPSMQHEVSTGRMSDLCDFLFGWLLMANLCNMFVFTWAETIDKKWTQFYIVSSWMVSLFAAHTFVPKLAWLIAGRKELAMADVLAFSFVVVCLVSSKMAVCHRSLWKPNKYVGMGSLMLTVLLVAVQPTCRLTGSDILKWLLICSAICGMLVIARVMTLTSRTRIHIASIVVGYPIGLTLAAVLFDSAASIYVHLLYGLLTTMCVELVFATWTRVRNLENIIVSRLSISFVLLFILSIMDWFTKPAAYGGNHYGPPGMLGRAGFFLVVASILKTISFLQESEFLTAYGSIRKSYLPIIGNILTTAAFVSVCCLQPLPHWEQWVLASSCITFLFQRDSVVLYELHRTNQITLPILIATVTFMCSAIGGCHIWLSQRVSFLFFVHLIELCIILLQIPVMFVFLSILWNGQLYISERFVVFLMPLASILFLIGSTYIAVLFGVYALLVGIWLMVYKVPLRPAVEQ